MYYAERIDAKRETPPAQQNTREHPSSVFFYFSNEYLNLLEHGEKHVLEFYKTRMTMSYSFSLQHKLTMAARHSSHHQTPSTRRCLYYFLVILGVMSAYIINADTAIRKTEHLILTPRCFFSVYLSLTLHKLNWFSPFLREVLSGQEYFFFSKLFHIHIGFV